MKVRRIVYAVLGLVLLVAAFFVWQIGPRNIIGMLMYDQRREGDLKVGDAPPDVTLVTLDGGEQRLSAIIGQQPLVLIFGSFT